MSSASRTATLICIALYALCPTGAARAQALPSVASINVCADQLVLSLADPDQIVSVSWLAADAEESMLASKASSHPVNYGSVEELLRIAPDVIVASAYTGAFARSLLRRLGYRVIEIEPAVDAAGIELNLLSVGSAIGQAARAKAAVDAMRAHIASLRPRQSAEAINAVLVRPGGFTAGAHSLAATIMAMSGLRNIAAEQGLDRWGSLSLETLLRANPDIVLITDYRSDDASLANAMLDHPVLAAVDLPNRAVRVPGRYWACGLPESLDSAEIIGRGLAQAPRGMVTSETNRSGSR